MDEQLKHEHQKKSISVDDEIHLLDLLIIIIQQKWLVIGTPILFGVMAMVASLLMAPMYTSTAKIMPPQQQNSGMSAMLGQLGGLAGAVGGIKNPNDLYVGMLESRTIADSLIKRFNLQDRYENKTIDDTRVVLSKITEIASGKKDGLISIGTSDEDPKFAADLANAYVEELNKLSQTMAISEASQRRLFFEKQLKDAKDELIIAEIALRETQERTGLIQPEGQVQAIIASIAQIKGTIAAKEVQLKGMRTFATTQNPDLRRAEEELRGLQIQLSKLEKNQPVTEGDFMVPTGRIPGAGSEFVRSMRDVKYYETLFELLAKQYELAKIEEAKDSPIIQLLDKAVPAEKKSKPKRAVITAAGFLGGLLLGVLLAFVRQAYLNARKNPENVSRWQELSKAWQSH